jgi:hypothetical protein
VSSALRLQAWVGAASDGTGVWVSRALLAEAAGCALLTFVVASAIDRQAVPGWAGLAIGAPALVLVLVGGACRGRCGQSGEIHRPPDRGGRAWLPRNLVANPGISNWRIRRGRGLRPPPMAFLPASRPQRDLAIITRPSWWMNRK